jgi:hypothetical protein
MAPVSEPSNLCDVHRLPGLIIRHGESTMVVTAWHAQHENECGVIVINDFALGDLFGGQLGFEKELAKQGFSNVRLLCTPAELEAARTPTPGKKVGGWSGPWITRYAWETGAHQEDDNSEDLQ